MTNEETIENGYGDALSAPFWQAAREHKLLLQQCGNCSHFQFYPRPYCLECQSDDVSWVEASGKGTVYSQTTVHVQVSPDFNPPYTVVLVELEEGPRLLGHVSEGEPAIGDQVTIDWNEREDKPPLPVFSVA